MTVATITISDTEDNALTIEGRLDPPAAIDLPPTPAVIVGAYLAVHIDAITKSAIQWFNTDGVRQ